MQLDHNRIAIRERSYIEVLDLALRVMRKCGWPLAAALAVGVVPTACFNAWLLSGYIADYPPLELPFPPFEFDIPLTYLWYMFWLVIFEAALATAPATLFLGESLFMEKPQLKQIARRLLGSLPQLIVYQLILRAILVVMVFTWFVLYAAWPYLNEVILLERNPMRRNRQGRMSTYRRTVTFHAGYTADLFGRWLGSLLIGILLFVCFWGAMMISRHLFFSEEYLEKTSYTIFYPLALWLVVSYFTVVRFLGYLDLRIRREGWEVELMMRAEQTRLERQLT
ncbi:MAG: hypothetical protein HQ567_22890 [Candidatus Nealsonbacteria bacterium]|nr:hypothetical protein [Candidatus Nealsonbacteria bacterium]